MVKDEVGAVLAAVDPKADVQSRVGSMLLLASTELNAVADRVTAKNEFPAEVEKCCKKLSRRWQKMAVGE